MWVVCPLPALPRPLVQCCRVVLSRFWLDERHCLLLESGWRVCVLGAASWLSGRSCLVCLCCPLGQRCCGAERLAGSCSPLSVCIYQAVGFTNCSWKLGSRQAQDSPELVFFCGLRPTESSTRHWTSR